MYLLVNDIIMKEIIIRLVVVLSFTLFKLLIIPS